MPEVARGGRTARMASLGGLLGLSEGLTFAWAGRADGARQTWGAALVGGGVGTALGLAGASSAEFTSQRALVSSGFAAWGGWTGSFTGALIDSDPRTIVLGGLVGANVGFAAGYGVTRTDLLRPEDFGWLSLAGAVGTVSGAGVGALFSTREDRSPILAGMAAGPLAGMATGALMLPVLRKLGNRGAAAPSAPGGRARSRRTRGGPALAGLGRFTRAVADVADWQPMFGALPSLGLAPTAPAVGGGVSGTRR
jgi:hypothetical protein